MSKYSSVFKSRTPGYVFGTNLRWKTIKNVGKLLFCLYVGYQSYRLINGEFPEQQNFLNKKTRYNTQATSVDQLIRVDVPNK